MKTSPADADALRAQRRVLELRARLNDAIRRFFRERGFLEVETPVVLPANAPEANIDAVPAGTGWIRTSPELAMKRLLAAGCEKIFQLGPVARAGEHGRWHHPEFTLLEWYRVGWDHRRLMDEVAELIVGALALVGRSAVVRTLAYRELFLEHLGIDPLRADEPELRAALAQFDIRGEGLRRDDWLDLLLTHRIEPCLREDTVLLVHDFPASQAALARIRPGAIPVAERFEALLGRIELANGYHELADAAEQRARFGADLALRATRGTVEPPQDERLLDALAHGLPDCAGVAMGIDRLLMAMLATPRIRDVIAFDFSRA